ncbi:diguanylate cyclase (GGDEF)-like protein/PAS domain S-box-containing protein [Desulfobaculum xiamenense]|uniref:Diguanylate cyclase (GGDEF)-like protein/PAS domain S-box-containing protein n=1 Tax=Desulfobaculum xiamenense TaxID=995050 RepID=A0A846QT79_9BACT|nr:PAS domain S-box protein [Desulfobaculum xiamenense]NJB67849.1 diguanylate cyclase (GGDEF)-like protein/PAS domain S-box-containing protein [Desulfobaculum xiamenense]
MQDLSRLISQEEDWLLEHILAHAKQHGYTASTSSRPEDWRMSVAGLSDAMTKACAFHGDTLPQFPPGEDFEDDPITAFGVKEAIRHRTRGVPLQMFLGLLKYYRQAYLDLVDQKAPEDRRTAMAAFILRTFDRFEMALCVEWTGLSHDATLAELQGRNRELTSEKNRYVHLFENLASPVFLLDAMYHVDRMNHAAQLLVDRTRGETPQGGHAPAPTDATPYIGDLLPWLAEALPPPGRPGALRMQREISLGGRMFSFDIACAPLERYGDEHVTLTVILNDITEFRNAERAAQRSEERFRRIFDSTYDAVVIHDLDGSIIDVNESMLSIFDLTRAEALRMSIEKDLSSPDNPSGLLPVFWEQARKGEPRLFEWKGRRPRDASSFDMEVFLRRVQFANRDAIMATIRDISDRKKAEKALRQSEEYHRTFFQNNHSIMLIIDPQTGAIRDANPAACDFYGYDRDTLVSMRITDINMLSPEETLHEMHRARTEQRDHFTFRHRLANGDVREVEVYTGPVTYRGTQLLYSVIHDVTEKNRMQDALKLSEEKFRRIFENMQDAYYLGDLEGWPILVNKALPSMLGYDIENILHMNMNDIHASPEMRNELMEELRQKREVRLREIALRRKDGHVLTAECNMQLIYDRGEPVAVEAICRDITDRKRSNIMLRLSEARFRGLFENSPISLWEEDFSLVKQYMEDLADSGVLDFDTYFASHDEAVRQCAALVRLLDVNQATLAIFEAESKFELLPGLETFLTDADMSSFREELVNLAKGRLHATIETTRHTLKGNIRHVSIHLSVAPGYEDSWGKVIVSMVDITDRKRLETELKRMATTDPLTGANNRRCFLERAGQELHRSQRYGTPPAFLMLDIDHFKTINDTYGHAAGDEVLKALVRVCKHVLRESDLFGRLGGEEFAALVIESDRDNAMRAAERLREELERTAVSYEHHDITFTVSIGMATILPEETDIDCIMARADKALYAAKHAGRNRVAEYDPDMPDMPIGGTC